MSDFDVLNLGCGRKRMDNALNVDGSDDVGADLRHDLNELPWPLPENRFREIHLYDVLEHLSDVPSTLGEIHRVACADATVFITVPHFTSANTYTDPTHRHAFGRRSFQYFTGEHHLDYYLGRRFRERHARIIFQPSVGNRVVSRLANRWPDRWEHRWAWIFPAWFLYFELAVVKT